MIKNILITGSSGLLGSEIKMLLQKSGYKVSVLSRDKERLSGDSYYWDIEKGLIDIAAIENNDAIIHLAGENISAKRWSKDQKKKIVESRIRSTELLVKAIGEAKSKPKVFISASAIGYYGTFNSDRIFKETDEPGSDFLAKTVYQWEEAAKPLKEKGIRLVNLRIGVVMSNKGGALLKMILPLRFGFSSPIGSGKQYIPWISLLDLSHLFLFALENNHIEGACNAVTSEEISNAGVMKNLAKQNRSLYLPVGIPGFILKLIYGEMAAIILYGSRVSNHKILQYGFTFKFDKFSEFYLSEEA